MSRASRVLRSLVYAYQRVCAGRPSPCRFQPSCSSYASEAVERHGARLGSWLAIRRICRCHPWGGQGWDPVPPVEDSAADLTPSSFIDRSAA